MTFFRVYGDEDEHVCSVLEELIVLAGEQNAFLEVQFGVVFEFIMKLAENLELLPFEVHIGVNKIQISLLLLLLLFNNYTF